MLFQTNSLQLYFCDTNFSPPKYTTGKCRTPL